MKRLEKLKIRSKINKNCCGHYLTNKYHIGHIRGLRICKVAICKECGHCQPVGCWFGNLLTKILGKLRTRDIEILDEVAVWV